jgi:hypothetical protein
LRRNVQIAESIVAGMVGFLELPTDQEDIDHTHHQAKELHQLVNIISTPINTKADETDMRQQLVDIPVKRKITLMPANGQQAEEKYNCV